MQIEEQSFEQGDALLAEIQAFIAAIRGQAPVLVSGQDGLRALETAVAITAAVHGGSGERGRVATPRAL